MVSNVAEAESMSKTEQGGWKQIFFWGLCCIICLSFDIFFLALCIKICRIKYNKEFTEWRFLDMEDLRGLALNKIAQVDLF